MALYLTGYYLPVLSIQCYHGLCRNVKTIRLRLLSTRYTTMVINDRMLIVVLLLADLRCWRIRTIQHGDDSLIRV